VKCTGAPKYPYKDILVHRCTSPMNKTTQPYQCLPSYAMWFAACCNGYGIINSSQVQFPAIPLSHNDSG